MGLFGKRKSVAELKEENARLATKQELHEEMNAYEDERKELERENWRRRNPKKVKAAKRLIGGVKRLAEMASDSRENPVKTARRARKAPGKVIKRARRRRKTIITKTRRAKKTIVKRARRTRKRTRAAPKTRAASKARAPSESRGLQTPNFNPVGL